MNFKQRVGAFVRLSSFLNESLSNPQQFLLTVEPYVKQAFLQNNWFTPDNVRLSLEAWAENLAEDKLLSWLNSYPTVKTANGNKKVMVIAAGNLPLVAFHDIVSVLITGNHLVLKQAHNDKILNTFLLKKLIEIEPVFESKITFVEGLQKEFDAVIATGSNNSARYFEQYFGHKPNIIRKNRNSVAVLTGAETAAELSGLSHDIMQYFGLGCRSVSKVYIPEDYDLNHIFGAVFPYQDIVQHTKYGNNYDYHRALLMLNGDFFLENGFMIVQENTAIASPVAVIYFERYRDINQVNQTIKQMANEIQCVVGRGYPVPFGKAQKPELTDYADGVDTISFLLSLPN
ncbi:MAG: acyl-CoA reductase [Luteibaculaceae bacterium]